MTNTQTPERQSRIDISEYATITLTDSKGLSVSHWAWDGSKLSHPVRGTLRLSAELTTEITKAISGIRMPEHRYTAPQPSEPDASEWVYKGIDDSSGEYMPLYVRPGTTATLWFGPADIAH